MPQYVPQNIPGKPLTSPKNGKLTETLKGYIIKLECLETNLIIEMTCDTGPELEMILTDLKRLKNVEITFPKLGGVIANNPVPYKPGQTPNTGVVHNTLNYTKGCVCFSCNRITAEQDKKMEDTSGESSCDDLIELDKLFDELDEQEQVELKSVLDDIKEEKESIHQRGPVEDLEWNIEEGAWLPVPKPKTTWHSEQCSCKECNPKMWEGSDIYDAALMNHTDLHKPIEHSRFCTCFKCEDEKTEEQIRNMFP